MKKLFSLTVLTLVLLTVSCKKATSQTQDQADALAIDTLVFAGFFEKHPDFLAFKADLLQLYLKHDHLVWYDKKGRIDFAEALYNSTKQLETEGVPVSIPYQKEWDALFAKEQRYGQPNTEDDLLISSMYFFYAQKVYEGVSPRQSEQTGWYLPREKTSYVAYLDELMKAPGKLTEDTSKQFGQYYNLKKGLKKLRDIEKQGGWGKVDFSQGQKVLQPGDQDPAIAQLRKRLFVSGDLVKDNGSTTFDAELSDAVKAYRSKQHRTPTAEIDADLAQELSVPVEQRIRTVIVNMERCRWIAPDILDADEVVAVNIPSYRMQYFRGGKVVLESNVVVGKELNQTVVFSGQMRYLVFSPYWNIPKSIINKEIKPGISKDPDYLKKHNMEWNGGTIRQKPGPQNSLGLVKFMFPNTNNIYLHDTPSKSLFDREERALSHGCVRVQKAKELAAKILEGDKNWTPEKIEAAMNAGKEKYYTLNHKIPVYIAYFTALADADGNLRFFEDIYDRDNRLADLLYQD